MQNKKITVNARKFDNSIHKSWKCKLLTENTDYWIFLGKFEREINHSQLGIIRRGTISYEYYWTHKWFNVFRFHEPEGDLKYYYCNINFPPKFENNTLDYVDLDLDILVKKDLSFEILDQDEFEENAKIYNYSSDLKTKIGQAVEELLEIIQQRQFPFNQDF